MASLVFSFVASLLNFTAKYLDVLSTATQLQQFWHWKTTAGESSEGADFEMAVSNYGTMLYSKH